MIFRYLLIVVSVKYSLVKMAAVTWPETEIVQKWQFIATVLPQKDWDKV